MRKSVVSSIIVGTIIGLAVAATIGFIMSKNLDHQCSEKYGQEWKGTLSWTRSSRDLCVNESGKLRVP